MVKVKQIHHMNLIISDRDLEKARDFYGRVLGVPEIKRPNIGSPGLWFGLHSNELHISVNPKLKAGRTGMSLVGQQRGKEGRHVAFTLSGSLDDIAQHLEAEGIPYVRGTGGLPQIFCEDPSGNFLELNTGWEQEPL
jgi:catechol 2,3-dioxygenase-like lactoylglutathione lyase family enzyme